MLLRMIQLSQSGCGSNQTKVMTLYLVTERLSSNFVDYLSNKIVSRSHSGDTFPPSFTVPLSLTSTLRYGENPHQKAAFYSDKSLSLVNAGGIATAIQHHGKGRLTHFILFCFTRMVHSLFELKIILLGSTLLLTCIFLTSVWFFQFM
jgi:hypothetical protein